MTFNDKHMQRDARVVRQAQDMFEELCARYSRLRAMLVAKEQARTRELAAQATLDCKATDHLQRRHDELRQSHDEVQNHRKFFAVSLRVFSWLDLVGFGSLLALYGFMASWLLWRLWLVWCLWLLQQQQQKKRRQPTATTNNHKK